MLMFRMLGSRDKRLNSLPSYILRLQVGSQRKYDATAIHDHQLLLDVYEAGIQEQSRYEGREAPTSMQLALAAWI